MYTDSVIDLILKCKRWSIRLRRLCVKGKTWKETAFCRTMEITCLYEAKSPEIVKGASRMEGKCIDRLGTLHSIEIVNYLSPIRIHTHYRL